MDFLWISEELAIISLYSVNLLVFKTEILSVFCAVRTGSLNKRDYVSCPQLHGENMYNLFSKEYPNVLSMMMMHY